MFGEQLGIQSTQECHFKGQSHVNLPEHNYCFFNVYILFSSPVCTALWMAARQ